MSSKQIKGITIDFDGNFTSLDKATEAYNKRLKDTQKQLNDVEKLLKLDPTNTELLAQKQKLLGDKIKITSESLKTLRTAQQQAEPNLKNYDAWQAKIAPINQKIQETNDSLRAMQAEQKKLADSGDVGSERYFELSEKIKDARKELKTLKDTQKTVSDEFGNPISQEQFDALRREIIKTEQDLSGLNKKAEETESAFRTAGQKAADGVEDITDEAKDAAEAVEDMKKEAGGVSDAFKTGVAVAGIQEITSALKNAVEETREYRTDMAKLETAYASNNHSAETAKSTYEELQAILGDSGQAVEAANHLALLTDKQAELAKWGDIAAGVYGTFGTSLPIENLAEASNETAKTGKITGALADALNWAGIKEDEFQARLDKCSSTSERATLITNTLSKAYDGAAKSFRTTNADMIASNKASGKLQDAMAQLGKKAEPILTALTKASANLLGILADGGPIVTGLIVAMATSKVVSFAKALDLAAAKQKILNLVQSASPMGLVIGGIAGITAALISYSSGSEEATKATYEFSDAEKEAIEKAEKAKEKIEDLNVTFEENAAAIEGETKRTEGLWKELQRLADESGNVREADQERAGFILGELNEALGTEYSMNDGIIGQYRMMQQEIDNLIKKRQAERLIEANGAKYDEAVANEKAFTEAAYAKEQAMRAENYAVIAASEALKSFERDHERILSDVNYDIATLQQIDPAAALKWEKLRGNVTTAMEAAKNAGAEFADAQAAARNNQAEISRYQAAEMAMFEGNYEKAIAIITDETTQRWHAVKERGKMLQEDRAVLKADLDQKAWYADWYRKQVEGSVEGFTEEGLRVQLSNLADLIEIWEETALESYDAGANIAAGIAKGMMDNCDYVGAAAGLIADTTKKSFSTSLQIKSPSRVMMQYGKYIAEGLAIGMDDGQRQVLESARTMTNSLLASIQNVDTSAITQNRFAPESMMQSPNHVANTYNRSVSVGGISVQVNAPNVSDEARLADMVADRLNDAIIEKMAVYT